MLIVIELSTEPSIERVVLILFHDVARIVIDVTLTESVRVIVDVFALVVPHLSGFPLLHETLEVTVTPVTISSSPFFKKLVNVDGAVPETLELYLSAQITYAELFNVLASLNATSTEVVPESVKT